VLSGMVSGVRDFRVFVNLGDIEGLIHISELSWQRVKHPRDVLRIGQEVEVKIIKVDPVSQRVGLSLKQLQADPWQLVEQRVRPGDWVEGRVTRLTSFGAFIDLGDGVEGLLHTSQMAGGEAVAEGETVRVRVVSVEAERQRIGLSLKAEGEARPRGRRPARTAHADLLPEEVPPPEMGAGGQPAAVDNDDDLDDEDFEYDDDFDDDDE